MVLLLGLVMGGCNAEDVPKQEPTAVGSIKPSVPEFEANRGIIQPPLQTLEFDKSLVRTALVIGNARYRVGPLKNPVNDATDVTQALRKLGFEVTTVVDATRQTMALEILQFSKRLANRKGIALFYYSGHGIQAGGRNYLVPVDADIDSEEMVKVAAVPADDVLTVMDAASTRLNLMILDACRNNPFARSYRSASQGLAYMDAPSGTLIAYATSPGRTAADGKGRNGTYTAALLKFIPRRELSLYELFDQVGVDVEQATGGQQVTWESDSVRGAFYFAKDNAPVLTALPPLDEPRDTDPRTPQRSSSKGETKTEKPPPATDAPAGAPSTAPSDSVKPLGPIVQAETASAPHQMVLEKPKTTSDAQLVRPITNDAVLQLRSQPMMIQKSPDPTVKKLEPSP